MYVRDSWKRYRKKPLIDSLTTGKPFPSSLTWKTHTQLIVKLFMSPKPHTKLHSNTFSQTQWTNTQLPYLWLLWLVAWCALPTSYPHNSERRCLKQQKCCLWRQYSKVGSQWGTSHLKAGTKWYLLRCLHSDDSECSMGCILRQVGYPIGLCDYRRHIPLIAVAENSYRARLQAYSELNNLF